MFYRRVSRQDAGLRGTYNQDSARNLPPFEHARPFRPILCREARYRWNMADPPLRSPFDASMIGESTFATRKTIIRMARPLEGTRPICYTQHTFKNPAVDYCVRRSTPMTKKPSAASRNQFFARAREHLRDTKTRLNHQATSELRAGREGDRGRFARFHLARVSGIGAGIALFQFRR